MTSRITIRPARPDDAPLAAAVFRLSMDHLTEYLFGDDGRWTEIALMRLFSKNAGRFGYGAAFVAELAHRPLGLMVSFPGAQSRPLSLAMAKHLPRALGGRIFGFAVRGVMLAGIKEAKADEYLISNLGVLPAAQGHGLGKHLLMHAEEQAHAAGLTKCALMVSPDNAHAIRLYKRTGYQIVFTKQNKNPLGRYHRMVKEIG
jgi:ribosomal protein S18 acetylase RimI-like enzyme